MRLFGVHVKLGQLVLGPGDHRGPAVWNEAADGPWNRNETWAWTRFLPGFIFTSAPDS